MAVCSAILGYPVVTYEEYQKEKQSGVCVENYHSLDIDQLFSLSHPYAGSALDGERQDETPVVRERFPSKPSNDAQIANLFTLFVKMIQGNIIPITTSSDELVSDVKAKMYEKFGIPSTEQRHLRPRVETWKTVSNCVTTVSFRIRGCFYLQGSLVVDSLVTVNVPYRAMVPVPHRQSDGARPTQRQSDGARPTQRQSDGAHSTQSYSAHSMKRDVPVPHGDRVMGPVPHKLMVHTPHRGVMVPAHIIHIL